MKKMRLIRYGPVGYCVVGYCSVMWGKVRKILNWIYVVLSCLVGSGRVQLVGVWYCKVRKLISDLLGPLWRCIVLFDAVRFVGVRYGFVVFD